MNALATFPVPDLNPLGPPSIAAACLCLLLATLASPYLRLSRPKRKIITAAAPLIILIASPLTSRYTYVPFFELWHQGRYLPNADDISADIIYIAFGFMFALNNIFFLRLRYRIITWVFTIPYGALIIYAAMHLVIYRIPSWRYNADWIEMGAILTFLALWLPILMILDRRMRRELRRQEGCCIQCGYNLTGNVSGICPECGLRIKPRHGHYES